MPAVKYFIFDRENIRRIAVLLTDGEQTRGGDFIEPSIAAKPLKNIGVDIYAVGIGRGAKRSELEEIVLKKENVHMLANFNKLLDYSFIEKFVFGCKGMNIFGARDFRYLYSISIFSILAVGIGDNF